MTRSIIVFSSILLATACSREPAIDFSAQVKPILNTKCISCHGGVKKQGGFSVLFEEEALAQLKSGAYGIVPGHPEKSEMIRRLHLHDPEERMPYKEEPLGKQEINILTQWIQEGAQWGVHWAYQKVAKPDVPATSSWARNDIDHFIEKTATAQGLTPCAAADPITLARRLSLDLIGFPAPDSLTRSYLENPTDRHYENLVDDLLASPHFGEKWAGMWLDLARYADTKGYERDDARNIWRYRDWLIKAFNTGMPYDQFLTEQLAGDLLPNPTEEQYIATAFHRNTMTNDEGGTDNEEFRTAAVVDRVNTTWETLLSTSFACVQCHSHPYDPFRYEDYYRFLAFFNNTRDEDTFADYPLIRHYDEQQKQQLAGLQQWLKQNARPAETQSIIRFIQTLQPSHNSLTTDQFVNAELSDTKWLAMRNNASARLRQVNLEGKTKLIMSYIARLKGGLLQLRLDQVDGQVIASFSPKEKTNGWARQELDIKPVSGVHDLYFTYTNPGLESDKDRGIQFDWFYFAAPFPGKNAKDSEQAQNTFWQLINANVETTPILVENPADFARKTQVFERGNWLTRGARVDPGVPASLNAWPTEAPANRLGLALWITDKDNPLTARTIVNRLWEQLYGYGILETLEDMGSQGASPTHRELLDYLSWQLMHDYQWSLKKLLKEMVLSATYRQSSKASPEQVEKDPANRYMARGPRVRLSAEQIRDQALAISGALNPEMYGPPVMPYQPDGIWLSPYNGRKWKKSEGDQQYRRAIYTYWKRTSPYPSMISFDGVGREVCSSRRIRTNTPLQALVTLNDSVYLDISRQFAQKVMQHRQYQPQTGITLAYELATGQKADGAKLQPLAQLYQKALEQYQDDPAMAESLCAGLFGEEKLAEKAALILVANAILNLDELITKS